MLKEDKQIFCISLEIRKFPKYIIRELSFHGKKKKIRMNKSLILINHYRFYGIVLKKMEVRSSRKREIAVMKVFSFKARKRKGNSGLLGRSCCQVSEAKETGPRWSPVDFCHLLGWAEFLPFACICQCKRQNLSLPTHLLLPPPPTLAFSKYILFYCLITYWRQALELLSPPKAAHFLLYGNLLFCLEQVLLFKNTKQNSFSYYKKHSFKSFI